MDFNVTDMLDEETPSFLCSRLPEPLHECTPDLMISWSPCEDVELTDLTESCAATIEDLYESHYGSYLNSHKPCDLPSEVPLSPDIFPTDIQTANGCLPLNEPVTVKLKSVLLSRQKQDLATTNITVSKAVHDENQKQSGTHESTGQAQSSLKFPPCSVCGGDASGLHYGVNTCEPCKGFFTRYLRKQDKEEYLCNKSGRCAITNRLRGNCSACRLRKCLELGMSRQRSRLGRYSLTRRMETILTVKKLEGKETRKHSNVLVHGDLNTDSSNDFDDIRNGIKESNDTGKRGYTFSVNVKSPKGFSGKLVKLLVEHMEKIRPYGEELDSLEQIVDKLHKHHEAYQLKIQMFGNLKTVPKQEYYNLLKVHGIEIDHRMMYLKQSANEIVHIIKRYCSFAKQIPHFSQLTNRDQSNLLKSSRYEFFMILMHEGYLHDKKVFLAHNAVAFHQEEVADKFFSRELVITVCDMYHRLQQLKLSPKEKALLIAISLLFTDRCTLDNPETVEKIQLNLVQLLRNQLEKSCPTSSFRRFIQIIDCLTIMRNSSELYLREYNLLCEDEHVIEEVPIMTEMLFDH